MVFVISLTTVAMVYFLNKWINNKDYLTNPNVLKLALNEFEKLMGKDNHIRKTAYYANLLNSLEHHLNI